MSVGSMYLPVPGAGIHVSDSLLRSHPYMRYRSTVEHTKSAILPRCRARLSERKRRGLVSMRKRRRLAESLRRVAKCTATNSRYVLLLQDRVATVRDELLNLALMLEHADTLDASWVLAVHNLLTDGCESPLYNRDVHISELWATLYYLRGGRHVEAVPVDYNRR
jgi:hypothetical protein